MKKLFLFLVIAIIWSGISYCLYHAIRISYILITQTDAYYFNYKFLIQSSFAFAIILILWKYTYLLPKLYRFLSLSLITGIFIVFLFYIFRVFLIASLSVLPVLLSDVAKNKELIDKMIAMLTHTFFIGFLTLMIGIAFAALCTFIIDLILFNSTHNNDNIAQKNLENKNVTE